VLAEIQPSGGGYLEAMPLTSFVVMSLAGCGRRDHVVVRRGVNFLVRSVREDGSWAIDTNLATWVTTLAVNSLAAAPEGCECFDQQGSRRIADWLLAQQYREEHPFTHAAPGGWAWTDLSGAVPDADDTAGVLLALWNLGLIDEQVRWAAASGVAWLVGLQNRDGGIPTFCRGWGNLPFDRSGADLTAHALAALAAWERDLHDPLRRQVQAAIREGVRYLARVQRDDGSWVPLWFGNQFAPSAENPTYGTARVLLALQDLADRCDPGVSDMLARGIRWLASSQNPDGGWGWGPEGSDQKSSVEETAVAVDALAKILPHVTPPTREVVESAVERGTTWLIEHTKGGSVLDPSPIGFYFAKLWYFERLYPVAFTLSALQRVRRLL
jgi:squalene-hopene/tetraprenyl-beta-curcumene cyclase